MSDEKLDIGVEQPFVSHLIELRDRLLRIVLAILVLFLALFGFANDIYHYIATPLMALLPEGQSMIATGVISPFLTPFKLTLVLSFYIAIPYILYQIWGFVAPGLYKHERRLVLPLAASSTILFYLGMVFAYYVVFPLIFAFLTTTAPEGVQVMPDMKDYLDFVLKLFFAFGVAFEVPIATILLCWMGTTTPDSLREKRPYVIVGAFVIGMLLTPPDMISQTLLAIPMWLLFEAGILFAPFFMPKDRDEEEKSAEQPERTEKGTAEADTSTKVASVATPSAASATSDDKEEESYTPPYDFDPTDFKSDYNAPTDEEMEAELDRIEAEESSSAEATTTEVEEYNSSETTAEPEPDEVEQARIERERKRAQREADNIRLDHYEAPLSERYEPLDEESEKMLDEELEMMDGVVDTKDADSSGESSSRS